LAPLPRSSIAAKRIASPKSGRAHKPLYVIIQSIVRLFSGLAISLPELNTVAHAICALFAYRYWFHKPKDVKWRDLVRHDWTVPASAYLFMQNFATQALVSWGITSEADLMARHGDLIPDCPFISKETQSEMSNSVVEARLKA
jgi:hypothetical protein